MDETTSLDATFAKLAYPAITTKHLIDFVMLHFPSIPSDCIKSVLFEPNEVCRVTHYSGSDELIEDIAFIPKGE